MPILPEGKHHRIQLDELRCQIEEQQKEIRQLEKKLEQSDNYEQMLEDSNVIITRLDVGFNLLYLNTYALSFFGFSEAELIGKNAVGTIIPFQASSGRNLRKMIAQIMKDPDAFVEHENENICKNGDRVYIAWRNKVMRDEKGNFDGLLSFGYDITRFKNVEFELRKAKDTAEAANIAKSEFLASMSHEIRTPMSGVIGMVEMLLDTRLTSEQKDYTTSALDSANSLLMLINDILDFSKIEAGKLDIEIIPFDLGVTLEDLSELISIKAAQKKLRFHLFIDSKIPRRIMGDPGRIRQILANLSGNAVKFTSEGDVTIRALLQEESANQVTVRFEVSDTGIGIPKDKAKKLFKRFAQADSSISRKYGGTGLGLSISKRLTELMGGNIGVNSEEGVGSTFWFTLDLEKQDRELPERQNLDEVCQQRILVADGSPMSRQVFVEYLTSWGCKLEAVENGQQALSALEKGVKDGTPLTC